jgi:hypothetical protein
MAKSSALLERYARMGAQTRLAELRAEIAEIERVFPDLAAPRRTVSVGAPANTADGETVAPDQPVARKQRRRKPMTAAQRKAVGERMKKYWAARRDTQSTKKR